MMPRMMRRVLPIALAVWSLSSAGAARTGQSATYDVVLAGGRVLDPESGLDGIRWIGISGGTIREISGTPLRGADVLDVSGLAVAPGFIDLHQHAQSPEAYGLLALSGTTTALELEEGTADVAAWYSARLEKARVNYGVSVGHAAIRARVIGNASDGTPRGEAATRNATPSEIAQIKQALEAGLEAGATAVGLLLGYTPGATPWEVIEVFKTAAAHGATVHVHMRETEAAQYFLETLEVIGASAASGAGAHIVHIQSSGGEDAARMLELIEGARRRGLDVTTEMYPYTASMTGIESPFYDDWAAWPDAKFTRFEWPSTGERLTRDTFAKYRRTGGLIVEYNNTEEVIRHALAQPLPLIASDGILQNGIGHPRALGTFARVLGKYVRDENVLSLMDAIRKLTLGPAQRVERRVPAMRRKGRVVTGADADLVVFDPSTIVDRATYRNPSLPPAGIRHVLVNGAVVVREGALVDGVFPGSPVRAH